MTSPMQPEPSGRDPLAIARDLICEPDRRRALSPGDLAELRRLTPDNPAAPSMWRVFTSAFKGREFPADDQLPGWACALQVLAQLGELGRREGAWLGPALAEAGLSELRLVRLLRAERPAIWNEVRSAAHFLAQKGVAVNGAQLALLSLLLPGSQLDQLRRQIAHGYYRQLHRQNDAQPSPNSES